MIRIVFFGDVVGRPGRQAVRLKIPELRAKISPDMIILNGENSANGRGMSPKTYKEYMEMGVDCITAGNHLFDHRPIFDHIQDMDRLIRPFNYPDQVPGQKIFHTKLKDINVSIVNFVGQVFMPPMDNPFVIMEKLLEKELSKSNIILVDFHAEATSEKIAFGQSFAGQVSAILGTHTHVQTSDAQILDQRTAYITDVGMVGAHGSILGMESEPILSKFHTYLPARMQPPKTADAAVINYVVIDIEENGAAKSIDAFSEKLDL